MDVPRVRVRVSQSWTADLPRGRLHLIVAVMMICIAFTLPLAAENLDAATDIDQLAVDDTADSDGKL